MDIIRQYTVTGYDGKEGHQMFNASHIHVFAANELSVLEKAKDMIHKKFYYIAGAAEIILPPDIFRKPWEK